MPTVQMKNSEVKEVPDEEMLLFIHQNRALIQNRQSERKRSIKRVESPASRLPINNDVYSLILVLIYAAL